MEIIPRFSESQNVWANLENKLQKKGECTIKYWACQSPKTRHPQHSRRKYYILMTSSAKLMDKKSPHRPINRRILINKMMKHNLIIIEFFYRKYILQGVYFIIVLWDESPQISFSGLLDILILKEPFFIKLDWHHVLFCERKTHLLL